MPRFNADRGLNRAFNELGKAMNAPMTFIVTIGLVVAVFAAALILTRAFGQSDSNDRLSASSEVRACPKCGLRNKKRAKYCGHCGKKLG